MSKYGEIAFRFFGQFSETLINYFPDLKDSLRRARMMYSYQEYLSLATFSSFLCFLISLPILSLVLSLFFPIFLFSFFFSFTISFAISMVTFLIFLHYPKFVGKSLARKIENDLPFAALYLSTISSSKLPLYKVFEIFERFGRYDAVVNEIKMINSDMKGFGLDVNTAIERAVERTPSKNMQEFLWGLLSTSEIGGDINLYLKEKAKGFFSEYKRKLYEFARSLTIYIEIYLTSVVLGVIFFVILTTIIAGIAGAAQNIILLQFFAIFVLLPLISTLFSFLIKSATPGGE